MRHALRASWVAILFLRCALLGDTDPAGSRVTVKNAAYPSGRPGIAATVVVRVKLNAGGDVRAATLTQARIVAAPDDLKDNISEQIVSAALAAARGWSFETTGKRPKSVETEFTFTGNKVTAEYRAIAERVILE